MISGGTGVLVGVRLRVCVCAWVGRGGGGGLIWIFGCTLVVKAGGSTSTGNIESSGNLTQDHSALIHNTSLLSPKRTVIDTKCGPSKDYQKHMHTNSSEFLFFPFFFFTNSTLNPPSTVEYKLYFLLPGEIK